MSVTSCLAAFADWPAMRVGGRGRRAGDARRRIGQQPAVRAEHRPGLQLKVAPPGHVGHVAERAHHDQAGALGRVGQAVREDRHRHPEQRRRGRGAEQRGVPLVVRVRDQRHAGRQQLGPGRRDDRPRRERLRSSGPVRPGGVIERKRQPDERARRFAVLDLGLRHGGAERHVPQRWRLRLVGLATGQVAQERALGDRPATRSSMVR